MPRREFLPKSSSSPSRLAGTFVNSQLLSNHLSVIKSELAASNWLLSWTKRTWRGHWNLHKIDFPPFIVIDDKGNDFLKSLNLG